MRNNPLNSASSSQASQPARLQTHRRLFRSLLATGLVCVSGGALLAQDYIFRPGPRGFDPAMNRYGTTENRPTPPSRYSAQPSSPQRPGTQPSGGQLPGAQLSPYQTAPNQTARPSTGGESPHTTLRIELLAPETGGGLDAQQWSRVLSEMGYSARVRSPLLDDKMGVEESKRGPLRFVTVIGQLDSRGQLHFPGRQFSLNERGALKEWLEEIQTYGAQGSPEGQPLWGLDQGQFERLYQALGTPVTTETAGKPLREALSGLGIPAEYPITFTAAAEQHLVRSPAAAIQGSVTGLSAGTALAYLLSEHSLGFRPTRTPSGSVALQIEPLQLQAGRAGAVAGDPTAPPRVWPVGWSLDEPAPKRHEIDESAQEKSLPLRLQLAPSYFAVSEISLEPMTLEQAFQKSVEQTGVPVLVFYPELNRRNINPATTQVQLPPRHQSWRLAMMRLTSSVQLTSDLRRDEIGTPFLWVHTNGR